MTTLIGAFMQAEPLEQRKLLDLSEVDTQLKRLNHQLRSLPQHEELKTLNVQRLSIAELVVASDTHLSDHALELERIESDLVPANERLVRNQARAHDGSVTDPRAVSTLLSEIDHLVGRISKLEDDQLELMQLIEDETTERDSLLAKRSSIESEMRELIRTRDAESAVIQSSITDLQADRAQLVAGISTGLLKDYERVAARWGTGAATLKSGTCTGCGLGADAATIKAYSAAKPDVVMHCEECGRILVRN